MENNSPKPILIAIRAIILPTFEPKSPQASPDDSDAYCELVILSPYREALNLGVSLKGRALGTPGIDRDCNGF